jgi:hypothetical protein
MPREKVLSWVISPGRTSPACSFLMSGLLLIWTRHRSRNEETIYISDDDGAVAASLKS